VTLERSNVLLLLIGDEVPDGLHDAVAARANPPARIYVVAPMLVGLLDWLATAEDDARRSAEVRALSAEWTLADQAETEGEAGDLDPIQAVEDALRSFAADEILIAGNEVDPDLEPALARFGLPVIRLAGIRPTRRSRLYRALRGLAAGRSGATPFVLFFGVNTVLFSLAILLSLLVLLILWLAGSL
jgi:hypothetical protein